MSLTILLKYQFVHLFVSKWLRKKYYFLLMIEENIVEFLVPQPFPCYNKVSHFGGVI